MNNNFMKYFDKQLKPGESYTSEDFLSEDFVKSLSDKKIFEKGKILPMIQISLTWLKDGESETVQTCLIMTDYREDGKYYRFYRREDIVQHAKALFDMVEGQLQSVAIGPWLQTDSQSPL